MSLWWLAQNKKGVFFTLSRAEDQVGQRFEQSKENSYFLKYFSEEHFMNRLGSVL